MEFDVRIRALATGPGYSSESVSGTALRRETAALPVPGSTRRVTWGVREWRAGADGFTPGWGEKPLAGGLTCSSGPPER
jgi:hypothetical protein